MSKITLSDVINQTGGSMQIRHGDTMIYAPTNDVHKAISLLKQYNQKERKSVIKSVNDSIKKLKPLVMSTKATEQEAMNCAQDITIWFANQILEGKATLEQKHLQFLVTPPDLTTTKEEI